MRLPVGKAAHQNLAEPPARALGDFLCEFRVGIAGKDRQPLERGHQGSLVWMGVTERSRRAATAPRPQDPLLLIFPVVILQRRGLAEARMAEARVERPVLREHRAEEGEGGDAERR